MLRIPGTVTNPMIYNRHGLPEWTYFDDGHATLDTRPPLRETTMGVAIPILWCQSRKRNRPRRSGMRMKSYRDEEDEDILHIDLEFTGVVYNASKSDVNLDILADTIEEQIDDIFTYRNNELNVNMKSSIKAASSVNDISDSDHVFVVVDGKKFAEKNALSDGEITGKLIRQFKFVKTLPLYLFK